MNENSEEMKTDDLIASLEDKGIKLWTDNGKLRYSAPQGVMNSNIVQLLKNNKDSLMENLSRAKDDLKIIHDEEKRYERFSLSGIQGAYLMGRSKNMEYGGLACHIYMEFEYDKLEREKTQNIWNRIISENDMLHAVIDREGWQRVLPEWNRFELNENDLTELSESQQSEAMEKIKRRLGNRVFNTTELPLFEVELSQLGNCTVMHFSIDMLIVDWTSVWLMLNKFEEYYYNGDDIEKHKLTITFRDYMEAYKNIPDTQMYKKAEKYWKERINDLPSAPQLPVVGRGGQEFKRFELRLPEKDWLFFKSQAQKIGVTPVAALVTAYSSALERFSTNKRFILNLTTLNRMPLDEQVKSLIGDFTSLSLITIDNRGDMTFSQRAADTNKTLFEVLDNHLYTGMEVAREKTRLGTGDKFLMPYVFTSSVGLINNEQSGAMKGRYRGGISQTPQVFIDCQVMDGKWGLIINWDVRDDIFPQGLPERMFELFSDRIRELARSAGKWNESSLIELEETEKYSDENNYQRLPEHLIHENILKSAEMYPNKTAVADSENEWSYSELVKRASAVALELRKRDVKRGSYIAVVMPKSVWQTAAVIGILSEGCGYVPIDAEQAKNRRRLVLDNADIKAVLTVSGYDEGFEGYDVIKADTLPIAGKSVLKAEGNPEDVAYIIHTSGSTGVPKGVVITHKAAVNTIEDINNRFGVCSDDAILGLSQLNFDLSVYDIFGVLSVGGTLVYPSKEKYTNPSHWAELISKYDITLWNSVPAFAQILCSYLDTEKNLTYNNFKTVMLSGDWIPLELPDALKRYMPNVRIACMGGATEASIWSNIHEYSSLRPEWKSIPYGRALLNQEMYVMDENLNICPMGVKGEICIGGVGLAKGYLNDKEKTDISFVTAPNGKRIYKTGDMGRYDANDEIEFLGRMDTQVKIRGHRIELGEIESCFNSCDGVSNSVSVLIKKERVMKLVLFVTAEGGTNEEALRKYAKDNIPEYMIPDRFVFLREMPLTPNGKVNNHKLKELAEKLISESKSDINETDALMTPTEIKAAEIVKRTLGIDSVDPNANLYDYGANSLVMAQLAGELAPMIKDASAFDSILMNLFEKPTVHSAAEAIDEINSGNY